MSHKEPNKFLAMEEEVAVIADRNPDPIIQYVPKRNLLDGVEAPVGYTSLVLKNTVLMFKEELVWTTTELERTSIRRFRTKVLSWLGTKYTSLTKLVVAWVGLLSAIPQYMYSTVKALPKYKTKSKNSRSS